MSDADRQEVQCVEEMEKYMEKNACFTSGRYSKSEIAKTFWRKGAPTRNRALETLEDKGFIIRQIDEKSKAVFYVMTKYLPKDM